MCKHNVKYNNILDKDTTNDRKKKIKTMENIEKYRSYLPIEYGYHSNGGRGVL